MQGYQSYRFFSRVFRDLCPIIILLGVVVSCGTAGNYVLPQASLPPPENEDTGEITVSAPDADGTVLVVGGSEIMPEDALIIVQVDEETDGGTVEDGFSEEDGSTGDNDGDDGAEDPEDDGLCQVSLPVCPEMNAYRRCHYQADRDGSFSLRVPAKVASAIIISYLDEESCGEVKSAEATVEDTPVVVTTEKAQGKKSSEGGGKEGNTGATTVAQNDRPYERGSTTPSSTATATGTATQPTSPPINTGGLPPPPDGIQPPPQTLPPPSSQPIDQTLPPPPDGIQPPPQTLPPPPNNPVLFQEMRPLSLDKYGQRVVTWEDKEGLKAASETSTGLTLPKRVTWLGNPLFRAHVSLVESQARFTKDEIVNDYQCNLIIRSDRTYTRIFLTRDAIPGGTAGAELFLADDYDPRLSLATVPVRRLGLAAVATKLGFNDPRQIRLIPFAALIGEELVMIVGRKLPNEPIYYYAVTADRHTGYCTGVQPTDAAGVWSYPYPVQVKYVRKYQEDGQGQEYLLLIDPVNGMRRFVNLDTLIVEVP